MIVLETDDLEHGVVLSAAQALDNDQYYAMVDSATNAIIVPLHPGVKGEIAECQVPSATVTGPIVQVYSHKGAKRLVVAFQTLPSWCRKSGSLPLQAGHSSQDQSPDWRIAHARTKFTQLVKGTRFC